MIGNYTPPQDYQPVLPPQNVQPPEPVEPTFQTVDLTRTDEQGNVWTKKDGEDVWTMEKGGEHWTLTPREGGHYRIDVRDSDGRLTLWGELKPDGTGKGKMLGRDGKWHDAYFRSDGSVYMPGEWSKVGDFGFESRTSVTILADGGKIVEEITRDPGYGGLIIYHTRLESNPDGSVRKFESADVNGKMHELDVQRSEDLAEALWWFAPLPGSGLVLRGLGKIATKIPGVNRAIPKIVEKLPIPKPRQAPLGEVPTPMPKNVPGHEKIDPPYPPLEGIPGVTPPNGPMGSGAKTVPPPKNWRPSTPIAPGSHAPPPQSWDGGAHVKIPKDWKVAPDSKGQGTRWHSKNGGVRVDKGDRNSYWPSQRPDHVIVIKNGRVIGRDGRPFPPGTRIDKTPEAHIPLREWMTWKTWDHP
ncbi:hypothetical protein [Gordonia malaquae]|uniref:hypothetical protein n=1 Tax=Gordonia malaquae TaxID=410332 RepID=UPI0030FEA1DC